MAQHTQGQAEATLSLTVDGRTLPFVFQKRTGGGTKPEGVKSFPGNMSPQKAHGGLVTVDDIPLEFEFVPDRDNESAQWLKGRSGKGEASLVEHGLDQDGNVWGILNRWTGSLGAVYLGDYDATSSDRRMGSVEIEADGTVG